jgi:hypothetical protein
LCNSLLRGSCLPEGLHAAIFMSWRGLDHHPSARGADEVTRLLLTANDWQLHMRLFWTAISTFLPCTSGMKKSVFWNITVRCPLKIKRRFWRNISTLSRISEARNKAEPDDSEDWGDMFLRNVCWLSSDYIELYRRRQNSSESHVLTRHALQQSLPVPPCPINTSVLIPWLTPCNNVKWSVHSKHITHATRSDCIWYSVDGMLGPWVRSLLGEFVWDILSCWYRGFLKGLFRRSRNQNKEITVWCVFLKWKYQFSRENWRH